MAVPTITTVANPPANTDPVEIIVTPPGYVTTMETLHFRLSLDAGFLNTLEGVVVEWLDQTGGVIYRHAVALPSTD